MCSINNNNVCNFNDAYAIVLEKNKYYEQEKRKQWPRSSKGLLHADISII